MAKDLRQPKYRLKVVENKKRKPVKYKEQNNASD
jgi:hypothetical protein